MARGFIPGEKRYKTPNDSFDAKVRKTETCWLWEGYVGPKGYGVIGVGNRQLMKAHRFSYERYVGPIPEGMHIDHLCRVRNCVNPEHLEPVTNRENVVRGVEARPKATHCSRGHKFTEENTYRRPDRRDESAMECRECRRMAAAAYKQRLMEK